MARCGCSSGSCGCVITAVAGSGLQIFGDGTAGSPYSFNFAFTSWTNIAGTYVNGFSAYTGTAADVPQWRSAFGGKIIFLRGRILGTTFSPSNTTMLTGIPAAITPLRNKWVPVSSDDATGENGMIEITSTGTLVNQSPFPDTWISLDGLMYEHD